MQRDLFGYASCTSGINFSNKNISIPAAELRTAIFFPLNTLVNHSIFFTNNLVFLIHFSGTSGQTAA